VQEAMVEVDRGVRLHVVESGDGPLVILLHGFPEFWYSWRKQIPALAEAGFRVVAPDMRGYNLSDKPRGVRAYRTRILARDVANLIASYGAQRAHVVGHDWGAIVAWTFAMAYPERLDRLAILNVPHPIVTIRALRSLKQLRRSWYVFFFQLPYLPERFGRAGNYAFVRNALPEDAERYVEAIARPGALTSAINYYRALIRYAADNRKRLRRISQPVLVVWGERDKYLGRELAQPPRQWVPNVTVQRLPNASHWVQLDEPDRVNELLINFLRG
jgi:epoxide hydrolase 4